MYTLLHGFYKYMAQKDEYCVLILGLDNAGKTVSFWFHDEQHLAYVLSHCWQQRISIGALDF